MTLLPAWLRWVLPLIALAVLGFLSAYLYSPGALAITPSDVLTALRAPNSTDLSIPQMLVVETRLPRIVVALLCGAVLAVSGLLLQTMTRNPLASPSLLSINAGAGLGVILAGVFMTGAGALTQSTAAAIGGALSWTLVMWISYRDGRLQKSRLILAGIAVSAFCAALGKASLILDENQASAVISWLAGGVSNMSWKQVQEYWPLVVVPAIPLVWLVPRLNILSLSDEAAQSLGVSVRQLRFWLTTVVLIWVGASVAKTGPIAFIGLLVPHLARHWIGYDLRRTVPMCALLGGLLFVAADLLARALAHPADLPAGAVLALIGAPCFVLLAKSRSDQ